MSIKITQRFNATIVLRVVEAETLVFANLRSANLRSANLTYANLTYADLRSANLTYANLTYADLRSANLTSADLRSADLRSANLTSADLTYADLRSADLRSANLTSADLTSADLRSANLTSADLTYADLRSADLTYADLAGAKINWQSHDLIAEILRRSAGSDFAKRQLAGGILVSRDWCWNEWLKLAKDHPLADWALDTLAQWVVEGDDAPEALRGRTTKAIEDKNEATTNA